MNKDAQSYWDKVKKYFNHNQHLLDDAGIYALKVFNAEIMTSRMIKYATMRHLLFLYKFYNEKNFPYFYDKEALIKLLNFSKKIIVPEINKPFIYPNFRKFITGFVFGWKYKNNKDKLITTEIYDAEARKQWKSSFWSMIMLAVSLGLLKDGNPAIYISGPQKDTSKIPYDIALNYILKSPKLKKYFSKFNTIHIRSKKRGLIKHLAFEKSALEGKNPSMVILTEYHLHSDDTMQESAVSSRNLSRMNQLIVYDTTKGHNINSVCFRRELLYKRFLKEQIEQPQVLHKNSDIFIWIAELDEEDYENWEDSSLWIKSNPALGISVSLESLKQEYAKIDSPASRTEFQIKRLGMWVGAASAYFSISEILESNNEAKKHIKEALKTNFKNYAGLMGLDLASVNDTASLTINFEIPQADNESIWVFKTIGFIPRDSALKKERLDRVPYRQWAEKHFLDLTTGDVIDFLHIQEKIAQLKKEYNILKLCYDPWQFEIVKQYLLKNFIFNHNEIVPVKQGVNLTPIFKQFERKLRLKKIYFCDNDYTIDHLTNLAVKETNNSLNENVLLQKINFNQRIDAVLSMLMSVSERINIPAMKEKAFIKILD